MNDFEITKREVLFSTIIVTVMLLIGLIIHGRINDGLMEDYQKYDTALKINNDQDLFKYGMKTNVGNAFVYGDLKAVDTVSYLDVPGEYMYICKIEEHYNMHTETYTTTDSKGNVQTHTRTYWSWDYAGEEDKHSEKVSFLGVEFDYSKIAMPDAKYIDTINNGSYVRFVYSGVDTKYIGTIFTNLNNETITDNTNFHENRTIDEMIKQFEDSSELVVFWVLWIMFIIGIVFIFFYIDNKWLEDKKKY